MKCPVCSVPEIPDDANQCPQCLSDLQAFHTVDNLEKSNKSRLLLAIISSTLFVVVLLVWVFTFINKPEDPKKNEVVVDSNEVEQNKVDNENLAASINSLKSENAQLKERLKALAIKNTRREKEYMVLNGETLYGISRKVYGNGYKYIDLAKDNNIQEPDKLMAGQKLVIYY